MRKIFFLLILSICTMTVQGKIRNLDEAKNIATTFSNSFETLRTSQIDLTLSHTQKSMSGGDVCYYVFNKGENAGFVIVSGDDRANEILGYTDSGSFDIDSIPVELRDWLQMYRDELTKLASMPETETNTLKSSRAALRSSVNTYVEPLLETRWNQRSPYNDLCPYDSNKGARTVTGCVATGMAQIMRYYKYPERGSGITNAYVTSGGIPVPNVDLSTTFYDWGNMKSTYGNLNTEVENLAVATLMYHCGVSLRMDYAVNGSAASLSSVANSLKTYFGYKSFGTLIGRYSFDLDEWEEILRHELDQARPVLYRGPGHLFICDGYDINGLFHINWGWGSSCDGYFHLSALDPDNGYDFSLDNSNHDMLIYVSPDEITDVQSYPNWYNSYYLDSIPVVSASSIGRNEKFDARVHFNNYFYGNIGVALEYNNQMIILAKNGISSKKAWTISDIVIPDSVANGIYHLYITYLPDDTAEWEKIRSYNGLRSYITAIIEEDKIIFTSDAQVIAYTDGIAEVYKPSELTISQLSSADEIYCSGLWMENDLLGLKQALKKDWTSTNTCENLVLKKIDMSQSVWKDVSDAALYLFRDCKALTSIVFPETVYDNPITFANAFMNCASLKSVDNLDKFTNIESFYQTFYNCSRLCYLTLSEATNNEYVTCNKMFSGCTNLLYVTNFEKLTNITNLQETFYNCSNLTSIVFGVNPGLLSEESPNFTLHAFDGCNDEMVKYVPCAWTKPENWDSYNRFEEMCAKSIIIATASEEGGFISPLGATAVPYNSDLSYVIKPNIGFNISDVRVDGESKGVISDYTFNNVTSDHSIEVLFVIDLSVPRVPVSVVQTGNGTVSPIGLSYVEVGSTITYSILPDSAYRVRDVLVDGQSVGAVSSYIFENIKEGHEIEVAFEKIPMFITAIAVEGGYISPKGTSEVKEGKGITYYINPNAGWSIEDVLIDGESIGGNIYSYTFENVVEDHTIEAVFVRKSVVITTSDNEEGSVWAYVNGASTSKYNNQMFFGIGSNLNVYVKPADGYRIVDVLVNDVSMGAILTFTLENVVDDHTILAVFAKCGPDVIAYINGEKEEFSKSELSTESLINAEKIICDNAWNDDELVKLGESIRPASGDNMILVEMDMSSVVFDGNILSGFKNTFKGCKSLKKIIFPNIECKNGVWFEETFANCESLETVENFEKFVYTPSINACFSSCYNLKSITFSGNKNNYNIDMESTFYKCSSLESVTNFNMFTNIFSVASTFEGCTSLKEVYLGINTGYVYDQNFFILIENTFTDCNDDLVVYAPCGWAKPTNWNTVENFVELCNKVVVTATAGEGGSIFPNGTMTVDVDENQIFTISPNIGYVISNVWVDGKSVGAVSSYTCENLTEDHTISVKFKESEANGLIDIVSDANSNTNIILYPNITSDGFYVNAGADATELQLYNMLGVLLLRQTVIGATYMDISELPQGSYFVVIGKQTIKVLKK